MRAADAGADANTDANAYPDANANADDSTNAAVVFSVEHCSARVGVIR